jgi:Holliday junction resolvasome RuvABC endonuclease subunit
VILGVDPGSSHVGWALLSDALSYVDAGVLEHEDARHVVKFIRFCVGSMGASRLVAVERVEQVNARAGFGSTMATGLCLAHGVGQRIVQALEDDGVAVREVTAEAWHRAYFERRAVDAKAVKALVQHRIAGWPTKSNAHARDAACIALWAAEARSE